MLWEVCVCVCVCVHLTHASIWEQGMKEKSVFRESQPRPEQAPEPRGGFMGAVGIWKSALKTGQGFNLLAVIERVRLVWTFTGCTFTRRLLFRDMCAPRLSTPKRVPLTYVAEPTRPLAHTSLTYLLSLPLKYGHTPACVPQTCCKTRLLNPHARRTGGFTHRSWSCLTVTFIR